MDFTKLIERVKNILMTPKTEWPVIAAETETVQSLYQNYILILAAIPAIFSLRAGIVFAVLIYVISLALTFVMALIIDALAPTFGGQKNQVQALKTAAYSSTPSWLAGVAAILPVIGGLVGLAAGIYAIYLLYTGISQTMKCPQEKAGAYTAVSIVIAIVLYWICIILLGMFIGASLLGGAAMIGALHH
jgi:hypothetical protein